MFPSIFLLALCFGLALSQNQCQQDRLNAVKSGQTNVRGSNLGSWFVLESWMGQKPWTDNGCDPGGQGGSYLLEQCLGNKAQSVMEQHWSTFITENDFAELSSRGINAVRLPVGWWTIYDTVGGVANANLNYNVNDGDYKAVGGLDYIDQAFDWGQQYGIAILLDMHAAPGSQNGNDNSSPQNLGSIRWDKSPDNVAQTVESIGLYAERYANHPAYLGFALLNEPMQTDLGVLQDYYLRAYDVVRQYTSDSYILINASQSPFESGTEGHWTSFMNPDQGFTKVAMDLHYYHCFGNTFDNPDDAIAYIHSDNGRAGQINDFRNKNPKGMIIGEWSGCGVNGKYNEFIRAQVEEYSKTSLGWTFWSWTPGSGDVWSLKTAFNNGWLDPQFPC